METFNTIESEADYVAWVRAHPDGYVVNTPRPRSSSRYLKLHHASCGTIGPARAAGGRLTGFQYQKVCSASQAELEDWARDIVEGELDPCGKCLPLTRRTIPASRPQAQLPRVAATWAADAGETRQLLSVDPPRRWTAGAELVRIDDIRPLLASWDAAASPSQIRLKAYLRDLADRVEMASLPAIGLYLDLTVDVEREERLLRHYDLENYLTPIATQLGPNRFSFARAVKRLGGGSSLTIGVAQEDARSLEALWRAIAFDAGNGAGQKAWKEAIRAGLANMDLAPLPAGAAVVDLAWRCDQRRNWVTLWKPTGDAMGPILGEPDARNPFNVADDRIVELRLHRDIDQGVGNKVHVGIAWCASES